MTTESTVYSTSILKDARLNKILNFELEDFENIQIYFSAWVLVIRVNHDR